MASAAGKESDRWHGQRRRIRRRRHPPPSPRWHRLRTPEGQALALQEAAATTAIEGRPTAPPSRVADGVRVLAVSDADRGGLRRVEHSVVIPAEFQYAIPKWVRPDEVGNSHVLGRSDNMVKVVGSVGIAADGYDYINRTFGGSFYMPETVHDENGTRRSTRSTARTTSTFGWRSSTATPSASSC